MVFIRKRVQLFKEGSSEIGRFCFYGFKNFCPVIGKFCTLALLLLLSFILGFFNSHNLLLLHYFFNAAFYIAEFVHVVMVVNIVSVFICDVGIFHKALR